MSQIRILSPDLDLVWIRIPFMDPNWLREKNRDQLKVWLRPRCRYRGMSELDSDVTDLSED